MSQKKVSFSNEITVFEFVRDEPDNELKKKVVHSKPSKFLNHLLYLQHSVPLPQLPHSVQYNLYKPIFKQDRTGRYLLLHNVYFTDH